VSTGGSTSRLLEKRLSVRLPGPVSLRNTAVRAISSDVASGLAPASAIGNEIAGTNDFELLTQLAQKPPEAELIRFIVSQANTKKY
jgi:hypothetical protein